ncbi:MAG TPA: c-type cytochrome, partial [Burkholderiaceae bacterium]|nr:c-type cytochrome [Burkholderiaceae bacterium]
MATPPSPRLQQCGACHGADGNSQMPLSPSLAGQPRTFLETQMILIREGVRPVPAMTGLLDGIPDAEIIALAKHYAQQPIRVVADSVDPAKVIRGRATAENALCGTCHLPDYRGRDQVPGLVAQREDYLLQTMRQFKSGQAAGRDTAMSAALYGLSDQD